MRQRRMKESKEIEKKRNTNKKNMELSILDILKTDKRLQKICIWQIILLLNEIIWATQKLNSNLDANNTQ